MFKLAATAAFAAALLSGSAIAQPAKPTVILVHGAFADSSSWNGVTKILQKAVTRLLPPPIPCAVSPVMRRMFQTSSRASKEPSSWSAIPTEAR